MREIKVSTQDSNLWVLNHTLGKTLKGAATNTFILQSHCPDLCPLTDIQAYVEAAASTGILLLDDYLFWPLRSAHMRHMINKPVSSSLTSTLLQAHMNCMGLRSGKTVHGDRGCCDLTLQLLRVLVKALIQQT